ncbi:unnamed protein product [Triticum turgidum subsp. durum]|uniref:DUF2428 domain-containing protein n=1 Tax=Triticum turgidum subsp. durum TaxID=4567 RepID=A0A9R0U573_TRITD|nr:unnamed protein product [Triticum turgidum subsp. durum]
MSSNWRSLQHRHRYTYTSVVFPKHYLEALPLVPAQVSASNFFAQLNNLISLPSTYAQIVVVKDFASAFVQFLSAPAISDDAVLAAAKLYLEILFFENSLPLHRVLISVLAKCNKFSALISACFTLLCEEYGASGVKAKKRFLVSRAALSLIGYPKLGFLNEAVEKGVEIMAWDVVAGLDGVIRDIDDGSRPSPVVMEQCQEAMSCMYYLLQRYPSKFTGLDKASAVFKSAVRTILTVLKSSAFSRDCLVASGVSFCAAIQVFMSPEQISWFISQGLFGIFPDHEEDLAAHDALSDFHLSEEIRDLSVLSRLCLLRGILTAIPRKALNVRQLHSNGSLWTVLYDGILPELCMHCENPIDRHFNFHALTVTQICLQQIKTSVLADFTDFSGDYKPFSRDVVNRVLKIIWSNLEDPLSQTVKQVHLIFDLLLDIESCLPSEDQSVKLVLCDIANDLLRLGPRCKGRYIPLASLTRRLGAKSLLSLKSNLLLETAYAYIDDDVCCAATSFLKCFLENLRDECWNEDGVEQGYDAFRGLCLPPLMRGLVSGNSKLRSNLNTYAVPTVIEVDTDSIFAMLGFISVGPSADANKLDVPLKSDQCIAALVSLLKVSRNLALVEGDIHMDSDELLEQEDNKGAVIISVKGIAVRVPANWFVLALTHSDETLRIDAAESLFLNPKTSSLPSSLELSLLKLAVPLNMRCSSTAFQMKWAGLFRKFFSRVRTALDRQLKQGSWLPSPNSIVKEARPVDTVMDTTVQRAEDLFQFMKWLGSFLFNSCYPSAPYERKTIAMELILIMVDVWPIRRSEGKTDVHPYNDSITLPDSTISFVGSIIDSWDKLRENSFRILLQFPTPLPGISQSASINDVIRWAKELVLSPRVRESDAGALTFRLIFRKYVLELGCVIVFSEENDCLQCYTKSTDGDTEVIASQNPVAQYISSLIQWLCTVVEEGERDLCEACKRSFVHGVLLTLRYTFDELHWNSAAIQSCLSEMRSLVGKLLQLIMRITSVALWVVSSDAWYMPYDMDDMIDDGSFLLDIIDEDQPDTALATTEKNAKSGNNGKPAEHVIMVGCWLAMKEVSLLFGTIVRKIPLPVCSHSNSSQNSLSDNTEQTNMSGEVLDVEQLEMMGDHFLQVLLKMKHNGAIDKTRAGLTALCNRLLCSNDSRLCKMTESWMVLLMDRAVAKGQTVDDLLRRSAGLPASFMALFLAEPEGTPKKLLPRALQWLIEFAKTSLSNFQKDHNQKSEAMKDCIVDSCESQSGITTSVHSNGNLSKSRDEGVVPTVHAFNVLRAAFNDANLAADTSGFCAEATIVAVHAFSSPYWEVRNAACLAYTALVRRMVGFLNVQKRESARRSISGLEFFHRYPALHPFLSSELKVATELLADGVSGNLESHTAKAIHPSLCPILILLSRLKPSPISCATDDPLDPFLLLPFIQKCATQSNYRVRVLASRALIGLVSNERLQHVVGDILDDLPCGGRKVSTNNSQSFSFNTIHGLLLQLFSLLDSNFRGLTDSNKKDQILGQLIEVLSKCSWLGCHKLCACPVVSTSYLRVLDQMLDAARTGKSKHTDVTRTLLLQLSSQSLNNVTSTHHAFHDPTQIEFQQQTVASYFSCVGIPKGHDETAEEDVRSQILDQSTSSMSETPCAVSLTELHKEIMSCLADPIYDVRITALKRILQLVKSIRSGDSKNILHQWARASLHSVIMERLSVEEHPKCLYYSLRIIFSWNVECQFNNGEDCNTFLSIWDRLVHLNSTVSHAKTREIILCCMGMCMKQFAKLMRDGVLPEGFKTSELSTSFGSIHKGNRLSAAIISTDLFVSLVKKQSAPSETVNSRRAAAEAIIASGLLEEANYVKACVSNAYIPSEQDNECHLEEKCLKASAGEFASLYACKILDLWFICIQLLEDEDVHLRQKLANDVQKIIGNGSGNKLCDDSTPLQVDRVIALSFEFITCLFGHWLKYVEYLLRMVLDTANTLDSDGDLVRQIFDKEIDNHHEEKLLICQISCSNIQKLVRSGHQLATSGRSEALLQNWRDRFLQQLTSLTSGYLEKEGKTDWIGGIGNHKDVFASVYANLLGLYALTESRWLSEQAELEDRHKSYLQEFSDLEGFITPFLKNPLISNLYLLVKRSHEREDQAGGSAASESFDPYFLLR